MGTLDSGSNTPKIDHKGALLANLPKTAARGHSGRNLPTSASNWRSLTNLPRSGTRGHFLAYPPKLATRGHSRTDLPHTATISETICTKLPTGVLNSATSAHSLPYLSKLATRRHSWAHLPDSATRGQSGTFPLNSASRGSYLPNLATRGCSQACLPTLASRGCSDVHLPGHWSRFTSLRQHLELRRKTGFLTVDDRLTAARAGTMTVIRIDELVCVCQCTAWVNNTMVHENSLTPVPCKREGGRWSPMGISHLPLSLLQNWNEYNILCSCFVTPGPTLGQGFTFFRRTQRKVLSKDLKNCLRKCKAKSSEDCTFPRGPEEKCGALSLYPGYAGLLLCVGKSQLLFCKEFIIRGTLGVLISNVPRFW